MGEQSFDVERDALVDDEDILNRHGYDTMPPFWPKFVHKGTAPWGNTGQTASHTSHKSYGGYTKPKGIGYGKGYQTPTQNKGLAHRWDQQAWNWNADDIDLEVVTTTSDDRYMPMGIDADEEDPFKRYEDIVEQACEEIDELVQWLNAWGFVANYSVIFDKEKAEEQDKKFRERMMQDAAPTP